MLCYDIAYCNPQWYTAPSQAYWVSHLFSGFLVAKTPFPLTFQFKSMLQRGVVAQGRAAPSHPTPCL